jgi:uncharacterized NAD(P)/FAD-binding protein YdhS
LWETLSFEDRERFLRHVARRWEVHQSTATPGWGSVVDGLLRDATARSLPLGLGFLLNGAGALVDTSGRASEQLYVLGAGRRGARWEAAAVPEIRDHATQLAPQLTGVAMDGGLSTGTAALSEGASAGA